MYNTIQLFNDLLKILVGVSCTSVFCFLFLFLFISKGCLFVYQA